MTAAGGTGSYEILSPMATEGANASGITGTGTTTTTTTTTSVTTPISPVGAGPGLTDSTLQLGGATITMIKGNEQGQQLSIVIESNDGKLIVVDGGMDTNRKYLAEFIQKRGGKVDCWLLTHPHVDHVGALTALLERQNAPDTPSDDYSKIEIGDIYYSFAPIEFYQANEPAYRIPVIQEAYAALAKHDPAKLHYNSPRGTEIWVGNIKITVMNEVFLSTIDAGNNTSIAYMIEINGKKLMILGDMPHEGAENLMTLWQPEQLKADVVQMAHHGAHGGTQALYQAIDPDWCLWPTHAEQWAKRTETIDPTSDVYTVAVTKQWMDQIGVQHHYVMCEGDWTLK